MISFSIYNTCSEHLFQCHSIIFLFSGGESIRMYTGRKREDDAKGRSPPALMDDNSD